MAIKAKISKIVKISLVLLLGIGIGIVGAAFLINKPFAKETETDVLANSEGKATKEKKVDKSNVTRTGYVVGGECTNLYLTKEGDLYVEMDTGSGFCQKMATEFDEVTFPGYKGNYTIAVGKEGANIEDYVIVGDGIDNYHVNFSMKVKASGIVNVFPVQFGQSYSGDNYILIDEGGNVAWFNIDMVSKKKVTGTMISNLEDCEGVVAAQSTYVGDGVGVVFIKEDGSQMDMTDRVADRISKALYE